MRLKSLILILLIACNASGWANIVPEKNTNPNNPNEGLCTLPAPTNFHAMAVGTDWVALEWTPNGPTPSQYRVQTYVASTHAIVSDIYIPGTFTMVRVNDLPQETYYSKITPVCGDGSESLQFAQSANYTIIISEIVVTGFQGSNSPNYLCQPQIQGGSCVFNEQVVNTFKIRTKNNLYSKQFDVVMENGALKVKLNAVSGEPFTFYCYTDQQQNQAPCNPAITVQIRYNGVNALKFKFEYWIDLDEYRVKLAPDNSTSFEFGLLAPSMSAPVILDHRDQTTPNQLAGRSFQISPNPFTEWLNIQFNEGEELSQKKINLYDLRGRLIMYKEITDNQTAFALSTNELAPGIYFLRVEVDGKPEMIKVMKTQ